jgi:hypothetical protein
MEYMKPASKAFAIIVSIVIVGFCLIYALTLTHPNINLGSNVDVTKTETLQEGDDITIDTSISGVTVTTDAAATAVTAHLYGSFFGLNLGSEPQLEINRSGSVVTVRAGRNWVGHISFNTNMRLDIVLPASFAGNFDCQSSAGAVHIDSDFTVKAFRAHSSAGTVQVKNVKASGKVEVSSSAGSVDANTVEAADADINSSAGRVHVQSCKAAKIRLHSSAGSVSAEDLSGKLDVSSSAGSVDVTLRDVVDSADISSSAGAVNISLPSDANANLDASTSAGSVSIDSLSLTNVTQKRDKVIGNLGNGGPLVKVHSSAGSVHVKGK